MGKQNQEADKLLKERISLRAHHLLCILGYRGKGYSEAFVANMSQLVGQLHSSPDSANVEIEERPDAICAPCPFLGEAGCQRDGPESERRAKDRDRAVMKRLDLTGGQRIIWAQVLEMLRISLRAEDLKRLCRGCQWLPLGYCVEGIERLRGNLSHRKIGKEKS